MPLSTAGDEHTRASLKSSGKSTIQSGAESIKGFPLTTAGKL